MKAQYEMTQKKSAQPPVTVDHEKETKVTQNCLYLKKQSTV